MFGIARSRSFGRLIFAAAALGLAALLRSSVGSPDPVPLRSVDGGQGYYGQFADGLPTDPSYFPLGVWFESVRDQGSVILDKQAGLNLYVALTLDSDLSLVQRNGMKAILQQDWRTNPAAINTPAVAGWLLADEIDMTKGPGAGYTALKDILAQLPNDRRMRYNNYGKGIMFWERDAQAARFVNDFQDVVSDDAYFFTDPNTPAQARLASKYGDTVARLRRLANGRKPIWNFVEVGWPSTATAAQGGRAIEPREIEAAVWHSIIAGARGIIYFNHSFGGPHLSWHCLREPAYAAERAAVTSTNQLITQLAPVLNSPFADGFVSVGPSVEAMAKLYDDKYYVFSGSKDNVASTVTFSLSGIDHGTAVVLGENRTIPISDGRFADSFEDGNVIHIYRIDGS